VFEARLIPDIQYYLLVYISIYTRFDHTSKKDKAFVDQ
jgi:hypothetical protein